MRGRIITAEQEDPVKFVLRTIKELGVAAYREIIERSSEAVISVQKVRRVIRNMILSGSLVELECRLLTTKDFLESSTKDEIIKAIKDAVKRNNMKRCVRGLIKPNPRIKIAIYSDGTTNVVFI